MQKENRLWTVVWYIFAFIIVLWIPIYFLWNTIVELFQDIPSNQAEFRHLFELEHGIFFYTFACLILIYMTYKAFLVALMLIVFLSEKGNFWMKILYSTFLFLLLASFSLPIVSYLIIWNNLYSDFSFNFTWMLRYVGVFETYMLFVVIFEAFILDIWIISFFTRIWMYGYLLYMFW